MNPIDQKRLAKNCVRILTAALLSFLLLSLVGCACHPNLSSYKSDLAHYHDGQYQRDLSNICAQASSYLEKRAKGNETNLAVVFDIDDTSLSDWDYIQSVDFGFEEVGFKNWMERANATAIAPTLALYKHAKTLGIKTFFITGRRESLRESTLKNLKVSGFHEPDGVFLRPNSDKQSSVSPFKTNIRKQLTEQGYIIVANIGDQDSDLRGGFAEKKFKLPNPFYLSP